MNVVLKREPDRTGTLLALLVGANSPEAKQILEEIDRRTRSFSAQSTLLIEGDHSQAILLVLEGWLALSKSLADGQKQIIDFSLPGDFVDTCTADGETSLITIEALTPGSLATIPYGHWDQMTQVLPNLRGMAHIMDMSEHSRRAERMLRLGKGTAEMRLAYALLELGIRLGSVGETENQTFHIPLTQQLLGEFIGLSSVHVCRTIRRMIRNGIVAMAGHMDIRIIDLDALADMAGVDPSALKREIVP